MPFEKFHYPTLKDLRAVMERIGAAFPLSDHTEILRTPLFLHSRKIPNRLAIQPMEGCDGDFSGAPGELTLRRYRRFAEGGAGLLWMEATAVTPEGRANPRQLLLNETTQEAFRALIAQTKAAGAKANGYEPLVIVQLTHSGRYAKPAGRPEPLIAYHHPLLENDRPIDSSRIVSDEYLKNLEETYIRAARLAEAAGADGVDIKCCHRYLLSELCSARTRPGPYGGSLENRTRLLRNIIAGVQACARPDFLVTCRLNIYDGLEQPYGFGGAENSASPDLSEPKELIRALHHDLGLELLNITVGNPYFNSYINRPADRAAITPPEHPLAGVDRIFRLTGEIASAFPDLRIISSGHSYLRQYAPLLAAGAVENGISAMAGFGREGFAYPDFAKDILRTGRMHPQKCCVACGKCTELMRMGRVSGCVVRDREVYLPIYRGEKEGA